MSDSFAPHGYPSVTALPWTRRPYLSTLKRVFDACLVLAVLPILVPLIALLWAMVRAEGGPGFYRQERVGQNGRRFFCYKLRTMTPDADRALDRVLAADPHSRAEWAKRRKLLADPRITRFGRFLRRSSLDELPQIWNVLRGDMALVGPRPVVPQEIARYGGAAWTYYALRPGLTGLWQVSARNNPDYAERVRLDLHYASRVSLGFDLWILGRTVVSVLSMSGR